MRLLYGMVLSAFLIAPIYAQPTHYVEVINDAPSTIQRVEVRAGSNSAWETMDDATLLHGSESATLGLRDEGGCRRDFRITFVDRRVMTQRIDVCRYSGLRTRLYWQRAAP
ncbi:MAG TPA: hypothetical protein VIM98_07540 [Dyella sp.]|uniref:hypothetical protein n=1 Tax=Dyella sp. TaxID=1869338 RepID=UPI002F95D175